MTIAVYLCSCGGSITERVDFARVEAELRRLPLVSHVGVGDFLCSEEGLAALEGDLARRKPERCVVGACSPREHEHTFRGALGRVGMSPFLLQMANLREQVAWVTADPARATDKALAYLRAAVARIGLHEPLAERSVEATTRVLVVGGGPAGLKATQLLAEAGREVVLVERSAALGGLPSELDAVAPSLECGSCLMAPLVDEVLHGPSASLVEVHVASEVRSVKGSYGAFVVELAERPRYVADSCHGCGECVSACPASAPDPATFGRSEQKAMSFAYPGALPNRPRLVEEACLRHTLGEDCRACETACPLQGAVDLAAQPRLVERRVGAVVLAIGAASYDLRRLPNLGYGVVDDVVDTLELERMLGPRAPHAGKVMTRAGTTPERVAFVHCAGSLDPRHCDYCSGVCCGVAFKLSHTLRQKLPGIAVTHLYKSLSVAGLAEGRLYDEARHAARVELHAYSDIDELAVERHGERIRVAYPAGGARRHDAFDMVVLVPAVTPHPSAQALGELFGVEPGLGGFFRTGHARLDAARAPVRGVYLAGACQSPMDLERATNLGAASAGFVLSGLVPGRKLALEPETATVNEARCSGCRSCGQVCPYKAVTFSATTGKAAVDPVLCLGCGSCVTACPAGAVGGHHFGPGPLLAELTELLR